MSDMLPGYDAWTGYDAWKTRLPEHYDYPDEWSADFECEECGHEFHDDAAGVGRFRPYRASGYQCCEVYCESVCPQCGSMVGATITEEPDWDDIAAERYDR